MKRNKVLTALCVPILAVALASCGENLSLGDEEIEITFWHTFSYEEQIQTIIDAFEEEYPNIHVTEVKQTGSYDDLEDIILNGFPTDYYPNMALCYPDHVADYLDTGKVIQMDDYMEDKTYGWTKDEREDMLENLIATGQNLQVEGTWCLPFAASTEALFYNSDVLIGLDLSSIDSEINGGDALSTTYMDSLTWEELFDHLIPALNTYITMEGGDPYLINDDNSTTYHGVLGYDSDANLFITLAEQYGYDYTSVNYQTGIGSIDFDNDDMKGLMKTFNANATDTSTGFEGIITQGTIGNYTNYSFVEQGCLMSVGSTGGVKYQLGESNGFTTYVASIPQAEGQEAKSICQGPSIVFLRQSDDVNGDEALASWLFYKFLTNTENTLSWALDTGYMPIRTSAYESDDWLSLSSESGKTGDEVTYAQVYSFYADVADTLFTSPVFKGSSDARTQAGSVMTQCLLSANIDAEIDSIFSTAVNQAKLALPSQN